MVIMSCEGCGGEAKQSFILGIPIYRSGSKEIRQEELCCCKQLGHTGYEQWMGVLVNVQISLKDFLG